jgi:hypothetical protein
MPHVILMVAIEPVLMAKNLAGNYFKIITLQTHIRSIKIRVALLLLTSEGITYPGTYLKSVSHKLCTRVHTYLDHNMILT